MTVEELDRHIKSELRKQRLSDWSALDIYVKHKCALKYIRRYYPFLFKHAFQPHDIKWRRSIDWHDIVNQAWVAVLIPHDTAPEFFSTLRTEMRELLHGAGWNESAIQTVALEALKQPSRIQAGFAFCANREVARLRAKWSAKSSAEWSLL